MKTALIIVARALQLACIIVGGGMMFLECEDFHRQVVTLVIGLVLFCVGMIPAIIESLLSYQEEQDEYIRR